MTLRFGRRVIRIQRRWPFVVTWLMPPSHGWWYRHFIEDIGYADEDRQ